MRRDLGDFQTPPGLVSEVLETLGPIGPRWPRVLEPTCGRGHFVAGLLGRPDCPREIQAIEIQEAHVRAAQANLRERGAGVVHVEIAQRDVFEIDLGRDLAWRERGPLLVIGNPPWVTNAELGSLASTHRPPRRNLKGLRGLDARTGSSNFDVAEAIWLKLAFELADEQPTIALLCKTSVARSVLQFADRAGLSIATAQIRRIDAARWFGAAVDACWFCVSLGFPPLAKGGSGGVVSALATPSLQTVETVTAEARVPTPPGPPFTRGGKNRPGAKLGDANCKSELRVPTPPGPPFTRGGKTTSPDQAPRSLGTGGQEHDTDRVLTIPVYANLIASTPESVMGFAGGWLIADIESHARWAFADGVCPMEWRQGLKHDAAAVMELVRGRPSGEWRNLAGEVVDVEPDFVYPLVKGTGLTRPAPDRPRRAILVTQERLGQETARLEQQAPRLWTYLQSHAASFVKRKSSIYRGRPPFSLFGIGPYSFAPFKVAISGMHKNPAFRALAPIDGKPVMLDDTCYFLPCSTAAEASVLAALCNDAITLGLIGSMVFRDSKRPITKRLLQRIDFLAVLEMTDQSALLAAAEKVFIGELGMPPDEVLERVIERMESAFVPKTIMQVPSDIRISGSNA